MPEHKSKSVPVWSWILVPAIISLAVTLLRLTGELYEWSDVWFGPLSPFGITWLVPIFGLYFGWRLGKAGYRPSSILKTLLYLIGAILVFVITGIIASRFQDQRVVGDIILCFGSIAAAYLGYISWCDMGPLQLGYGLAARIPVVIVSFIAIYANWGTHYDDAGDNFPEMGLFMKWVVLGLLPQMTLWMAYTIIIGILFGLPTAIVAYKMKSST